METETGLISPLKRKKHDCRKRKSVFPIEHSYHKIQIKLYVRTIEEDIPRLTSYGQNQRLTYPFWIVGNDIITKERYNFWIDTNDVRDVEYIRKRPTQLWIRGKVFAHSNSLKIIRDDKPVCKQRGN